jgi:hypothetical protein
MLAPQRGRDSQETPYPISSLGHPLPKGEGSDPHRDSALSEGRGCPDWSGRVRGLFPRFARTTSSDSRNRQTLAASPAEPEGLPTD